VLAESLRSGVVRRGKYNGAGELVTRNGITTYRDELYPGKEGVAGSNRVLKSTLHHCRSVRR
jgi:hypothetical protein